MCIYLYICILFVQINVSLGKQCNRELREGAGMILKQVKYFSISLEFQLLVNCKYDLEEEVVHQGTKVCIYLLMLLLYYTAHCINNWNDSNNNLGIIQLLCMPYFIDIHFSELCTDPQPCPV